MSRLITNEENKDTMINMDLVTNILKGHGEVKKYGTNEVVRINYKIHFGYSAVSEIDELFITWEFKTEKSRDKTFKGIAGAFDAICL